MSENTFLGGGISSHEVSITTGATEVGGALGLGSLRDGLRCEVRIGAFTSAGAARAALLYGSATAQVGYIPAGVDAILPVPLDKLYVKSVAGTVAVGFTVIYG